jgi:hypothetical protein
MDTSNPLAGGTCCMKQIIKFVYTRRAISNKIGGSKFLAFSLSGFVHYFIHLWFYSSLLDLCRFLSFLTFPHSQEDATCTHRTTQTQNKSTDIPASSGIRTHVPCLSGRRQFMSL